jgi:pimeloyl-ACP methyl ester carboxylesterase
MTTTERHVTVSNGPVQLATTDFGGSGPDLVLMHGLGLTRRALQKVARLLTGWRVITMDLRGHGESTTAPWDFDLAVSDLDAVVGSYGLQLPYVGGHSLGGMVALRCSLAGRPVAGAINVDGWGPGLPAHYLDEDLTAITEYLEQAGEGHLPSRRASLVVRRGRQWREGTTQQVLRLLHGADVVDWHAQAPCPTLAVYATQLTGRAERWLMGAEYARRQDAHRRGLRLELAALVGRSPLVRLAEVDAGHGLCATRPGDVAAAIEAFRVEVESQQSRV